MNGYRHNSTFKVKAAKPRPSLAAVQAKRKPFPELLAAAIAKRKQKADKPRTGQMRRNGKPLGAGPRTKEWRRAWAWLKPRLEAAGRTFCEFDFIIHECDGPLDPAHSKKRSLMHGDDIYAVAIACRKVHRILDEKLNHEQMEVAVMHAIDRHGGMITPAIEAAKKGLKAA